MNHCHSDTPDTEVTGCPGCGAERPEPFFELDAVPVHIGYGAATAEAARNCARGDIRLAFCPHCALIWNLAFDAGRVAYGDGYDNCLHASPRFREYARSSAVRLIQQYGIRHKDVVDIGCGNGAYLRLLCELGDNRGVGFDPACEPVPPKDRSSADVTFLRELYGEAHAHHPADLVCLLYVLEHLAQPRHFLAELHRNLRRHPPALVHIEVPNALPLLREHHIWSVIYEHHTYFSVGSLAHTLEGAGFAVCDAREANERQLVSIDARTTPHDGCRPATTWDDRDQVASAVAAFARHAEATRARWRAWLDELLVRNQRVVMWGAGSKGISFLNMIGPHEPITHVVDINPRKTGWFLPGTGQQVVAPNTLSSLRPDVVLITNPIYKPEIQRMLRSLAVSAEVVCV